MESNEGRVIFYYSYWRKTLMWLRDRYVYVYVCFKALRKRERIKQKRNGNGERCRL